MKNYYELTRKLNFDNVSFDAKMSVYDIMALFQQAVTDHTFILGMDFKSILEKHNAKWFIVSAQLEIDRAPMLDELVTVKTWPQKSSALKFPRIFTMSDQNGKLLATAKTDWCIVDNDTEAPLRASTLTFPFDSFIEENPIGRRVKMPACESFEHCYSRKMLLSDIDLNRHVNNVSYVRIAMDSFTSKEVEQMNINGMLIQYKMQCFEGDTLDVYRAKHENGYLIEGRRMGDLIFKMFLY